MRKTSGAGVNNRHQDLLEAENELRPTESSFSSTVVLEKRVSSARCSYLICWVGWFLSAAQEGAAQQARHTAVEEYLGRIGWAENMYLKKDLQRLNELMWEEKRHKSNMRDDGSESTHRWRQSVIACCRLVVDITDANIRQKISRDALTTQMKICSAQYPSLTLV